ncbi:MAG TPA: LpqB family beta-propeller domain-containing protein [Streptosporangiaceae bacterium]|nr:LpqB family beta-propeller domain-containing protein [Streptosporangiaceae bacterium]
MPGRRGRPGARTRAGRVLAAAAAALAITLAGACAAVPYSGIVTSATIAQKGGQQAVVVQVIPSGPQPGWDPESIVYGFLLASANFTDNHAIAREYLTPAAAKAWRPGSSVTELADMPMVTTDSVQANAVTVRVTGNALGTISADGQYRAAEPGVNQAQADFTVVHVKGQWRIVNPPSDLLFSKTEVSMTFRSRDLFFFDPTLSVLVPDPVFVPAQATSQQLVANLVAALGQGPQGWLASGTRTAFPPGTRLLGTSVAGSTVTVNLGGRVAATGVQQREQMAAQLFQTLASAPAYSPPDTASVQSVVFEINGTPVHLSCTTGEPPALQNSYGCAGPVPAPGSRAYYVDGKQRVATLFGSRPDTAVPGPAGTGQPPFTKIAVSPDQLSVAGVSAGALYTGGLTQNGSLTRQLTATRITALSWDSSGGLWVSGEAGRRARVWWLDRGARPVVVNVPDNIGPISVLRVAPDGVRVAMVAGSGSHTGLWLAAIQRSGNQMAIGKAVPIGTDIPSQLIDLTWYDTSDVIALTKLPSSSELYEVPVDGGQSRPIATESGTIAIAASSAVTGASQLVAALSDGTLVQLPDPSGSIWRPVDTGSSGTSTGRSPVYPG